ncbi:MAG: DUF4256 domain-containing protein [Pleomorphochaeta sp.]
MTKLFIKILKDRFENNKSRHENMSWQLVEKKLKLNPSKINILEQMELSGGEPDVVFYNKEKDEYTFFDCSKESPSYRRSLCYDRKALNDRKKNKPNNSAIDVSKELKIEILNEKEYIFLQTLGDFDTKTSSWILTPPSIRNLGGALFCDKRYNHVFMYHNSAESYYSSRGFRGKLLV